MPFPPKVGHSPITYTNDRFKNKRKRFKPYVFLGTLSSKNEIQIILKVAKNVEIFYFGQGLTISKFLKLFLGYEVTQLIDKTNSYTEHFIHESTSFCKTTKNKPFGGESEKEQWQAADLHDQAN